MRVHTRLSFRRTLVAVCILAVCTVVILFLASSGQDQRIFDRIAADLFHNEMVSNTLNMHYTLASPADFGIEEYQAILPCYSSGEDLTALTQTENLLFQLQSLDTSKLSDHTRFTHGLLKSTLENSLALNAFPYYEEPLSPSSGMQSQLPILLAEYTFRSLRDVEDYLALLDQTDEYFEAILVFEQEKADAGLLMPSVSLKKVIEQCDTILNKEELNAGTHFLQTTFVERLEPLVAEGIISSKEATSYQAQNDRLLRTVMLPAYEALGDGLLVLEDPTIPLAGLASKPEGTSYYEQLVISQTGSYRSIEEIRQMVIKQFNLEYQAMKEILLEHPQLATISYSTMLEENFPLQNAAQMLADLQQRMTDDFPALDENEPLPSVAIKPVSANLQDYCAPAFYLTPPLDDTSSNAIYINEKSTAAGVELYTTLAHEGYPGHMYQSVYHNRNMMGDEDAQNNYIRELLWYGGYLEGWALYVEFLSYDYAEELCVEAAGIGTAVGQTSNGEAAGGQVSGEENVATAVPSENTQASGSTPEIELQTAALEMTKHDRSLMLSLYSLLDIMIHYENASQDDIRVLLGRLGITNESSIAAVYEYIVEEPTNYLKYYLGYLEILELKEQAKELWGEDYSDYRFHTFFLECGPADFKTLGECLVQTEGE